MPSDSEDSSSETSPSKDDRIRYLKEKIAKLERKKEKIAKKEKKKEKKKAKKEKKRQKSSEASSDQDEETETQTKSGREEWMTGGGGGGDDDFVFPCVSIAEVKAERKKEREEHLLKTDPKFKSKMEAKKLMENPGSHRRELNPYWKDGGVGLPSEEPSTSRSGSGSGSDSGAKQKTVGDGGTTWLRRAFKRAQEMAAEQGRPIEEVVAERWGSVQKLEDMMSQAEGRTVKLNLDRSYDSHRPKNRRDEDDDDERKARYKRPSFDHDDDDRRGSRPSSRSYGSGTQSWRKPSAQSETSRESREKPRNSSPEERREADRGHSKEKRPRLEDADSTEQEKEREGEKKGEEDEDEFLMTPAEMNALGAKIVKAEIMGNKALAAKLQAKLDKARKVSKGKRIIVQTKPEERRKPDRVAAEMHQYKFDDRHSLKGMFTAEKSGMDTNSGDRATYSKMSARAAKMAAIGMEERVQPDEWDEDGAAVDKTNPGKTGRKAAKEAAKFEEAELRRAENLEKARERQLDTCNKCFDSPKMIKHLMIAMGSFTYLSLPGYESLAEGHCMIAPLSHVPSSVDADENVWEETKNFAKSLVQMFNGRGEDCVFFEYFRGLKSKGGYPHLTIQCVPLPMELGDQAPIYFKKALMESETEWSQNKKVVDIPKGKDVRSVVPKGLPYFFVSFGWDDMGFAHIIEDEALFRSNFAQEILGGMLELEPRFWRKPNWEDFSVHCQKVEAFSKAFKRYDWTAPS